MVMKMCQEARIPTRFEPRGLLRTAAGAELIPDVVLQTSTAHGGATVATDVTVVHPLSSGFERGVPAAVAANQKITKYEPACQAQQMRFIPLAWDAYGAMDSHAVEFVQAVSRQIAERLRIPYSIVKFKWSRIFSSCLQRSNADTIISQYDQITRRLSSFPDAAQVQVEYLCDYS